MIPSMKAMANELVLIKQAAWQPPSKEELKTLAKNVGAWGVGLGIGSAGGYALRKKVLPHLTPHLGPKATTALLYGGGALAGLLTSEAFRRHLKRLHDAK